MHGVSGQHGTEWLAPIQQHLLRLFFHDLVSSGKVRQRREVRQKDG